MIKRLLTALRCRIYGHKWCNEEVADKTGWVWQSCECGHRRYYNIETREIMVEVNRHFDIVDETKSKDYYEERRKREERRKKCQKTW